MSGAGQRTEEATPKRRADARRKGQIPRSPELNTAVAILGGAWLLQSAMPKMMDSFATLLRQTLETAAVVEISEASLGAQAMSLVTLYADMVAPVFLGLCVLGIVCHLGQSGFLFSAGLLQPQFSRINPLTGAQRMLSSRAPVELVKSLFKLGVIGYVAWSAVSQEGDRLGLLALMPPAQAAVSVAAIAMGVVWKTGGVCLVIAGADFVYQRWSSAKNLRMTREEVKQEMKESEGNPEVKARMRQRARAIARRRMMQDVPKADVVLANPTHFAVALRYEPGTAAPRVVARGADFIAQQIKRVAREHGVPVVENKPLTQALYKACEVGQSVPPELYRVVAEVLAFVYRLRAARPRVSGVGG